MNLDLFSGSCFHFKDCPKKQAKQILWCSKKNTHKKKQQQQQQKNSCILKSITLLDFIQKDANNFMGAILLLLLPKFTNCPVGSSPYSF